MFPASLQVLGKSPQWVARDADAGITRPRAPDDQPRAQMRGQARPVAQPAGKSPRGRARGSSEVRVGQVIRSDLACGSAEMLHPGLFKGTFPEFVRPAEVQERSICGRSLPQELPQASPAPLTAEHRSPLAGDRIVVGCGARGLRSVPTRPSISRADGLPPPGLASYPVSADVGPPAHLTLFGVYHPVRNTLRIPTWRMCVDVIVYTPTQIHTRVHIMQMCN